MTSLVYEREIGNGGVLSSARTKLVVWLGETYITSTPDGSLGKLARVN